MFRENIENPRRITALQTRPNSLPVPKNLQFLPFFEPAPPFFLILPLKKIQKETKKGKEGRDGKKMGKAKKSNVFFLFCNFVRRHSERVLILNLGISDNVQSKEALFSERLVGAGLHCEVVITLDRRERFTKTTQDKKELKKEGQHGT